MKEKVSIHLVENFYAYSDNHSATIVQHDC